MSDRDPPRLSDTGDSAFLRDALRESKNDLPDEARLAAIALKLGPIVGIAGGAAGAAGGGGGGAAAAGGSAAAKASVAPAAAKIGGMTLGMKIVAAAAVTVAVGGTAVVAPRVIAPKPGVTVTPTAMVSAPRASSTMTAPIDLSLPPASASAAPLPVPSAKATAIVPPNPNDEIRQVQRAQDALATNPAEALSLCNDDAIIFPRGQLAQDREVIAIDALMRLGKKTDARARAKKFEADYPGSADLPRVRQLIGGP